MADQPVIAGKSITCGYDDRDVLHAVNVAVGEGEFLGLIGPNGSGKSTLLRALTGILPLRAGIVMLAGQPLDSYSRRQIAQRVAVVPQVSGSIFSFTVEDYVLMGRTPHLGRFQAQKPDDLHVAWQAMELADLTDLASRPVTELSGGELQRATLARAFAQQTDILLLDEPTAFLDINHQHEIFELLTRFNQNERKTIVCVSHDLNLAAQYCQRLIVLSDGRVHTQGPPPAVVTAQMIARVYHAEVQVDTGPGGAPRVSLIPDIPDSEDEQI